MSYTAGFRAFNLWKYKHAKNIAISKYTNTPSINMSL